MTGVPVPPGAGVPEPLTATAPAMAGRVIASQRWSDLTFLHWRVPSAAVAPLLAPDLVPDEFDGDSWVGLIPFRLHEATLAGSPPVPWFGDFVEVNVRLYAVDAAGRRGVVFRSLEASRLASVLAAQAVFGLPYRWAATGMSRDGDRIAYRSRRHGRGLTSRVTVDVGDPVEPDPLALFLTARWGMFTHRLGRTRFWPNEHEPWPLRAARLLELDDDLVAAAGLPGVVDRAPDSVLYSPGVVTRFGMRRASDARGSVPR